MARLIAFEHFRGLAILLIVIGHSIYTLPWFPSNFGEKIIFSFIADATCLFVFISGFFFHHVFYNKITYQNFLIKKSKKLLIPYLFLSSSGFFLYFITGKIYEELELIQMNVPQTNWEWLKTFLIYILEGRLTLVYWYIPFIMIIFLLSPVFNYYIRLQQKHQLIILVLWSIFSIIIWRPYYNFTTIHSVLYFIPMYLGGIYFSIHHNSITEYIKNKIIYLGVGIVFFAFLQIYYTNTFAAFHKKFNLTYTGIDFSFLQKICTILFLVYFFEKYKNKNFYILKFFASISFPLYFVHVWGLFLSHKLVNFVYGGDTILSFFLNFIFTITISIGIIFSVKKILGKKSAYLIGS